MKLAAAYPLTELDMRFEKSDGTVIIQRWTHDTKRPWETSIIIPGSSS